MKGIKSDPNDSQKLIRTEKSFTTSTPFKYERTQEEDFDSRLQELKKKVNDTLTFLHQERNDFLPKDDIIIPTRKDDHVSMHIDLNSIKKDNKKNLDNLHLVAEKEVSKIVKKAEDTVNNVTKRKSVSFDDCNKIINDLPNKEEFQSEEAFKFLENEESSPIFLQNDFNPMDVIDSNKICNFQIPDSPTKIPIAKPRQIDQKQSTKNIESSFEDSGRLSPTEADILSKIPVSSSKGGKMKTIKKHSKDPLKEFVNLSKDVNWDETDDVLTITNNDPIVKTTVTRITTIASPEATRSKIPILHTETLTPKELSEKFDLSQKSKIPILHNETITRITSPDSVKSFDSNLISPNSDTKFSVKSSTNDSDSETDSRRSPPLKGILKKTSFRTVGSSSGSDVALHEAGAESSEDESGAYF